VPLSSLHILSSIVPDSVSLFVAADKQQLEAPLQQMHSPNQVDLPQIRALA